MSYVKSEDLEQICDKLADVAKEGLIGTRSFTDMVYWWGFRDFIKHFKSQLKSLEAEDVEDA